MEKIIKVKNLVVELGGKRVLDGLNIEINEGESIVIVGSSGCGKTVLIKTILGLIDAEEGEIYIFGRNILKIPEEEVLKIKKKIGMVFQNSALFDSMNVWQNVGFYYLYHTDMREEEVKEKVRKALESVGLKDVEELMPEQLSGGMKKRVSIARALISEPEILFYDEPTTGLDPITSESITKLMKEIHEKFKTTTITVSHDVKLASIISDRIALLENGKIAEIGTFEELRGKSENPLIKSFVEMGG